MATTPTQKLIAEGTARTITQPLQQTDFSLVLGGPLFQIFRRTHLAGPSLELLRNRVLVVSLLAWLPLAVLSAAEESLLGGSRLPFLYDLESHVRFLVAVPVLIVAEVIVNQRSRVAVNLFEATYCDC